MSESIIFRGTHIRYFDGRQEEGGAFVRVHLTSEFSKPVLEEMGWQDPGPSVTDAKLGGELLGTHMILTPGDERMSGNEIQFDIRSVEDFKVVTIEKDEVKRRELRFVVRSSAADVAAKVDGYIRRVGDHQGALKIAYVKQEQLPLQESKPTAPKKESTGCKFCDAGIPKADNDDAEHVNGEPCKLWDEPLNPAPPMETATLKTDSQPTEPESYRPTREKPNEDGVYSCDPTFLLERKCGKVFGKIETLMISEGDWASALTVEDSKRTRAVEPLSDFETFSSLDIAIAIKAFAGEKIARAEINHHKGAAAVSWLELAGWFQKQWTDRRGTLAFETVEDWAAYLEGMLDETEPVEAVS